MYFWGVQKFLAGCLSLRNPGHQPCKVGFVLFPVQGWLVSSLPSAPDSLAIQYTQIDTDEVSIFLPRGLLGQDVK